MNSKGTVQSHFSVSQEELLSFLMNPHSYPHQPKTLRLVQTHSAYVIIVSPYVYKIRKPVDFGFLDFSDLEKRHHFSKREIELNRRLCPEIYIGVIPISLKEGHLAFGEGDEVVEYAVKMHKLPGQHFLKERLRRDDIQLEDLDRLALKLKYFYEDRKSKEEIEKWGRIEKLRISTEENLRQIEGYIDITLTKPTFMALQFYTDSFYTHKAFLFHSRIREGRIKDCHGDLHLDHIHINNQSVCIYDCIEFNDRFRYIDVANDIAFLAMDLDFNGRPDLAAYFTMKMANLLEDSSMLQIMDFYKCYRAIVSGKCESLRSREREVPESQREMSKTRAQRYFRLALRYSVVGSQPMVLIVMGHVASGKSALAMELAMELGWEVLSTDRIRKEITHSQSNRNNNSWLYSDEMKNTVYERLFKDTETSLKKGRGLILDATFSRRAHRDQLRERLDNLTVPYCFIETRTSDEVRKERLLQREGNSNQNSDARLRNFDDLKQFYEPPDELHSLQALTVDTKQKLENSLRDSLKGLIHIQLQRL